MQSIFNFIGYQLFKAKPKVYFTILGIVFIISFFEEYEIIKYIGIGLLIVLLILIFFFTKSNINPQEDIPVVRKGLPPRTDYLIIATVPKNKWTEHLFLRIGIDLVDEPYTYIYRALLINNDTYVYKLDDIWVEKESNQETEYSKFIGIAIENYLIDKKSIKNLN